MVIRRMTNLPWYCHDCTFEGKSYDELQAHECKNYNKPYEVKKL